MQLMARNLFYTIKKITPFAIEMRRLWKQRSRLSSLALTWLFLDQLLNKKMVKTKAFLMQTEARAQAETAPLLLNV